MKPIMITTLYLLLVASQASASTCAPGDHWIDTCNAGTETYNISMYFGLDTDSDSLANVDASFYGTATISHSDPVAINILEPEHLNAIGTQIVSMNLTGSAGGYVDGWTLHMGSEEGLADSTGYIIENTDPLLGDSKFDTVFEIRNTHFGTLHHNSTFFFSALIGEYPSLGTKFKHVGGPFGTDFALYDATDANVINLVDLIDTDSITIGRPYFVIESVVSPVPVPAAVWLFGSGLIAMIGFAKRRQCSSGT